jgi:hypothetical protein
VVPVTLSRASTTNVTLNYSIASGPGTTHSAKATGGDYGGKTNGVLAISAGKVLRTINIPIWPSAVAGSNKTIVITLSGAGVNVTRGQGTAVIVVP